MRCDGGWRSGRAGVGLKQKILDQPGKACGVFNLRPVTALAKYMQLRARNPLRKQKRVRQRNHSVFTAMHDQRVMRQGANVACRTQTSMRYSPPFGGLAGSAGRSV